MTQPSTSAATSEKAGATGKASGTSMTDALEKIRSLVGVGQYEQVADFPVERGYIWTTCSSVENGNPLFWDDEVAEEITGGPIAPPTMLSVWFRPHHWAPGRDHPHLPLQVHFDLKDLLALPEAVMTDNTLVLGEPVRPGDLLRTRQILQSLSEQKRTKLGTGRFWVIDVEYENQRGDLVGVESYTGFGYRKENPRNDDAGASTGEASMAIASGAGAEGGPSLRGRGGPRKTPRAAAAPGAGATGAASASPSKVKDERRYGAGRARTLPRLFLPEVASGDRLPSLSYDVTATTVVLGAVASRDWRPMHHDKDFAQERNGTRDIFLNTPNQAAWFERYVTDWTGPHGRLGRMSFRMRGSVFPGDKMTFDASVSEVGSDDSGCGWVGLDVTLAVGGDVKTTCDARVAVPVDETDNPWARGPERWDP